MSDFAIKVDQVTKTFRIPHERHSSLKANAVHIFSKKNYTQFDAVKNASFEIKKGEFFGIVGRNGSGKSTLLKLLAKIYLPTSGNISIKGSLSPFIELGVGFNPELTARENVFLNGAILGLNRKQIAQRFNEIIGFAELEEFVDQKLKNFSSGMQVRLAFSIAIQAHSDILLIDEVLAVGDANFQQKCFDVFIRLKKEGKTIVLVTHDMSAVTQFCDRAFIMQKGRILHMGKPIDIAENYRLLNYTPEEVQTASSQTAKPSISDVAVMDASGSQQQYFQPGEEIKISFRYTNHFDEPVQFGLQVNTENEVYCFGTNTKIKGLAASTTKTGVASIVMNLPLQGGNYRVTIAVLDESATRIIDHYQRIATFRIAQIDEMQGICRVEHEWNIDV